MTIRRARFRIPPRRTNKTQAAYYVLKCIEEAGYPVDREGLERLRVWANAPNFLTFLAGPRVEPIFRDALPLTIKIVVNETKDTVSCEWTETTS